eukprot:CAMPEP_0202338642 /NCGR_PEP_ID=MMETSP1126-20121109/836_1 /ASSEMBLY_ACC=CAM_ASM_000457 /TAXON_ID=3047 /ORGANISM="Dunaliella tertiolecta, Strain CCMP1320" /LENGTH=31 /DNA_ID= /DNA_START= /DNA_END= /DNA_ORIENTATION=
MKHSFIPVLMDASCDAEEHHAPPGGSEQMYT